MSDFDYNLLSSSLISLSTTTDNNNNNSTNHFYLQQLQLRTRFDHLARRRNSSQYFLFNDHHYVGLSLSFLCLLLFFSILPIDFFFIELLLIFFA